MQGFYKPLFYLDYSSVTKKVHTKTVFRIHTVCYIVKHNYAKLNWKQSLKFLTIVGDHSVLFASDVHFIFGLRPALIATTFFFFFFFFLNT